MCWQWHWQYFWLELRSIERRVLWAAHSPLWHKCLLRRLGSGAWMRRAMVVGVFIMVTQGAMGPVLNLTLGSWPGLINSGTTKSTPFLVVLFVQNHVLCLC